MAYTLIIKGSEQQVRDALLARGVWWGVIKRHATFNECTVLASADTECETLSRWFCETCSEYIFPAGSLLWYGPRVNSAPANLPILNDVRGP